MHRRQHQDLVEQQERLLLRSAELRGRIQSRLQEARVELAGLQDAATAQVKVADEFVHEHPWQSIGIAAAIGLVVGLLVARR